METNFHWSRVSWKDWLSQFYSVLIKKCMKFVCGLVESCIITLAYFEISRYLKINFNLSVKSKFYCRCLPLKLLKYSRHSIVEKSGRFFLMRLLLWMSKVVVQVFYKRYSINFHKKTPMLGSLFNMKLQRLQRRCFPVNFAKF